MQVAILADTHVPDREQALPEPFRDRIATADHVVHVGDFTASEVFEDIRDLAAELTAVRGNMDGEAIDLPTTATVDLGGVSVGITHGHLLDGDLIESLDDWYETVARAGREAGEPPRIGVGAHSHQVVDETHDGVRVLNPGTATGADPAEDATMLTVEVDAGDVDVTVHELE